MTLESDLFERLRPDEDKLIGYGFQKQGNEFTFQKTIMKNAFLAVIQIEKGQVKGKVIDCETNEEYVAVHTEGKKGSYASKVRSVYLEVLEDIAHECFFQVPFLLNQSNRITELIWKEYGIRPSFIFEKFPHYGAFRKNEKDRWFALIMDVKKEEKTTEIINVKVPAEKLEEYLQKDGIFPAFHMNKKHWVSISLEEVLKDEEIMDLIRQSRGLVNGKSVRGKEPVSWFIPANPKYYDVYEGFRKYNGIHPWKQRADIHKGDLVYIYMAAPVSAVTFQCEVIETDIEDPYEKRSMLMKLLRIYEPDELPRTVLQKYGVNSIRGTRRVPIELAEYMKKYKK